MERYRGCSHNRRCDMSMALPIGRLLQRPEGVRVYWWLEGSTPPLLTADAPQWLLSTASSITAAATAPRTRCNCNKSRLHRPVSVEFYMFSRVAKKFPARDTACWMEDNRGSDGDFQGPGEPMTPCLMRRVTTIGSSRTGLPGMFD